MSASLELEIKSLLDELGQPSAVAERLIPFIEGTEDMFTTSNVVTLSRFLLKTGQYAPLIEFVIKHFGNPEFRIPWPYFLEAIVLSRSDVTDMLADVLLEGIAETKEMAEASRSKALDLHTPTLKAERADRRLQIIKGYQRQKDSLLEQLVTLRTQQLYERERQLLQRLQRMYPGDPDVEREARNHRERYALEVLAKHSRMTKNVTFAAEPDPEVEALKPGLAASLREHAERDTSLAPDLAIAAAMADLWDEALDILAISPIASKFDWMRLELLLGANRHLELLNELPAAEQAHAGDSETFFATAYLRAQAMWALGQKHQAIEILESLLAARPQYRAGVSLLTIWKGPQ